MLRIVDSLTPSEPISINNSGLHREFSFKRDRYWINFSIVQLILISYADTIYVIAIDY